MSDDGVSEDDIHKHRRNLRGERKLSDVVDDDNGANGAEEEEPLTLRLDLSGEDLPTSLYLWLSGYAAEEERPVKEVVVDAIKEYLQRNYTE